MYRQISLISYILWFWSWTRIPITYGYEHGISQLRIRIHVCRIQNKSVANNIGETFLRISSKSNIHMYHTYCNHLITPRAQTSTRSAWKKQKKKMTHIHILDYQGLWSRWGFFFLLDHHKTYIDGRPIISSFIHLHLHLRSSKYLSNWCSSMM